MRAINSRVCIINVSSELTVDSFTCQFRGFGPVHRLVALRYAQGIVSVLQLQRVAACCGVLWRVVVCCCVSQCVPRLWPRAPPGRVEA